ncbi:23995_t:CDS:1, partial [Gigaspora rosea]
IYTDTEEEIYYNPWENETSSAVCLVEAIERTMDNYNVGQEITTQQKKKAYDLLLNNHDVFATDISESGQTMGLGCTTVIEHHINTGNAAPIKQKPY